MQMGLKIIQILPDVLRAGDYKITATVGLRRDIAEVMNVEPGDTSGENYIAVVDMGTTTIVAHLVEAHTMKTVDAKACFNSQGVYGREVTRRMITAEQKGVVELQRLLVEDINGLITSLADANQREAQGHHGRGLRGQHRHGAFPARAPEPAQHPPLPLRAAPRCPRRRCAPPRWASRSTRAACCTACPASAAGWAATSRPASCTPG